MEKKTETKSGEAGEIILFVIFVVLFLVLFVSLFLSRTLARQSKTSTNVVNSIQAYFVADTGAENVLYFLTNTSSEDADDLLQPGNDLTGYLDVNCFDGNPTCAQSYTAKVSDPGSGNLKIDIIGTQDRTSRAIQLYW